jgi:Methyltransferase domain
MKSDSPAAGRCQYECIACGAARPIREWSVTSSFFSERALLAKPEIISILKCSACGTQYFDLLVTDEQLDRLYEDYRGEKYFKQRHHFEPWYTSAINSGMGGDAEMSKRRVALKGALAQAGVKDDFRSVLDHGGDRGQMLRDLRASRKSVHEISGVACDPGIEAIGEVEMRAVTWDLILSCHVLEHLTFPGKFLTDLVSLGRTGTIYYIEVPDESVPRSRFNATAIQRQWLRWLIAHPHIFKLFDFLSTGIRARLGVALPLMFFPLREHLTFFTVSGLKSLLTQKGLSVLTAEILDTGHIGVVAVKR